MVPLMLSLLAVAAPPKVVAPEWNVLSLSTELQALYSQTLAEALRRQGLEVITAREMAALLGLERQRQLTGCSEEDGACMAELSDALGADATLLVHLSRFRDGSFGGQLSLVNSLDGKTLSSAKLSARSDKQLVEAFERAAEELAAPWAPKREPPPPLTVNDLWGLPLSVGLAGAAAGAALLIVTAVLFERATLNPNDVALREAGKATQTAGWISAISGGALLVTGILFAAWPKAPAAPVVALGPDGALLGLSGRF